MSEIRKININKLYADYANQVDFAEAVGVTPGRISHLLTGHKQMGEKAARSMEKALGLPDKWLDTLIDDEKESTENKLCKKFELLSSDQRKAIELIIDAMIPLPETDMPKIKGKNSV